MRPNNIRCDPCRISSAGGTVQQRAAPVLLAKLTYVQLYFRV